MTIDSPPPFAATDRVVDNPERSRFELFAESDGEFFLKVVDAQVTFTRDAAGAVTGLVLHQNGANMPGKKK